MAPEEEAQEQQEPPAEAAPAEAGEAEAVEVPLARISDRFLAYVIDALLFLVPAGLTLPYYSKQRPVPASVDLHWHLLWAAFYVLYQAALNSGGRATLGKKLLGLRVVTLEGEPLGFGRSLARALLYFVSAAPVDLGFAWAAADSQRRAWHDFLAGTLVLEAEDRGTAFRGATAAISAVLFVFLAFTSIRPWLRYRSVPVMQAQKGLDYVAGLEEAYRAKTGSYTDDIAALSNLAGGGAAFKSEVFDSLQPKGFGISVEGDKYYIVATALDGTQVKRRGP